MGFGHNLEGTSGEPEAPLAPAPPEQDSAEGRKTPPALASKRGEILLSLAAVLAVVAVLGFAELGVRLTRTAPETSMGPFHVYSEIYGWELRKNLRFEENGVRTTTNALGYRGAALPREKRGRTRIVLLGDSVSFGLEVDDERVFTSVLQSRRGDLEIANLSVSGYDPGQELIKLEREGLPLSPDVVVVALCLSNDFADAVLPVFLYDGRHPKPYFAVEKGSLVRHDEQLRLSVRERLSLFLAEHSRLYELLTRPPNAEPPTRGNHWIARKKRALKDHDGAVDMTARLLARMKNSAQRAGATFIVLAFPDSDSFLGPSPWLDDLVRAAPMKGVAVVDMAERFKAKGLAYDTFASDGIGHLSPAGHEATAEILAEDLVERGLLSRDPRARP